MQSVVDEQALRAALVAEQAILFLHAPWSIPSMIALRSLEKWEKDRSGSGITSVRLCMAVHDGDSYPPLLVGWLKLHGLDRYASSGGGEVLWVQSGRIVATLVWRQHESTAADISRRTAELWGLD